MFPSLQGAEIHPDITGHGLLELGVKDMMDALRIPALGDAIHLRIALECLQSGQQLPLLKVCR
jgi:hypothetical protein